MASAMTAFSASTICAVNKRPVSVLFLSLYMQISHRFARISVTCPTGITSTTPCSNGICSFGLTCVNNACCPTGYPYKTATLLLSICFCHQTTLSHSIPKRCLSATSQCPIGTVQVATSCSFGCPIGSYCAGSACCANTATTS